MRIIQAARRLYKPSTAALTPAQYVELNRRFVNQYLNERDDPEIQQLSDAVENYQARLDMLELKDYQLRHPVTLARTFRKVSMRSLTMLLLLPLALPGALLHLPVGWIAATVGERFSYEMDDIATLKVFATILLLPLLYLATAAIVGLYFGPLWALAVIVVLPFSFFASVRLLEAEAGLFNSILSLLRLTRLRREVDDLRTSRSALVQRIRDRVERKIDPGMSRMFTSEDFATSGPDAEKS